MDRRKKTTGKIKGMFHTSGTKHGSYSVGLTVLVIAIVIVFNLVIGQIPPYILFLPTKKNVHL